MDRLLVVRCPELRDDDEGGATRRRFATVLDALGFYCPWVTPHELGLCSLPARGPARYFGGEEALVSLVTDVVSALTPVEVGIADGLFAATLAARGGLIVPAGETPEFLAPWPIAMLGDDDLADLLGRLGLHTLGAFARLPEADVLGRFGSDGIRGHQVARGARGDLLEMALRPSDTTRSPEAIQIGFWGGVSETDARATRALGQVQAELGAEAVLVARLQGGRGPADQARFVTWTDKEHTRTSAPVAPWPGHIPPPAPITVYATPRPVRLLDPDGQPVTVTRSGLLGTPPASLFDTTHPVLAWAGPWPVDERWWTRQRRRGVRIQVVVDVDAHLLVGGADGWAIEATYA